MKKALLWVGILSVLFLLLAGCSTDEEAGAPKKEGAASTQTAEGLWLKSLEVYSNAVNSERIYHVAYPYRFYAFETDINGSVSTQTYDLIDHRRGEELSEEELRYFIDYVKGLPENQKGESLSYFIICRYRDEEGKEESVYRMGYDTFPEEWDEFLNQYNKLCGGEYLFSGEQIQTVTPEFLTEVFGVTDEDVREGTLQDVIDVQKLDMTDVTSFFFRMEGEIDGYYGAIKEPLIEPHRPRELIQVESTQEEYDAFLESFFGKISDGQVEEVDSDQDYFRYFYTQDTGKSFYTARTSDLDKLPAGKRDLDEYYFFELDAHMEDMIMLEDFIYSADRKFILVPCDSGTDVMLAFCE